MTKIEKAVSFMEAVANDDTHGYDQVDRNGPVNYDCSGLVIAAWTNAGVNVKKAGATYTGNMPKAFLNTGFTNVIKLVDVTTGKGLVRGDVLLSPYHHTAVYCGNNKLVHASSNEFGKATGGKSGDQTGKEICIRTYYNYPWTYVLRYTSAAALKSVSDIALEVIKGKYGNYPARKDKLTAMGYDYAAVQAEVNKILKNR